MRKTSPFIIIAQQLWELKLGSNAKNIAIELSKATPVLYVNPPLDVNTVLKEIHTPGAKQRLKLAMSIGNNTTEAAHSLWVHTPAMLGLSINRISSNALFDALNKLNSSNFWKSVRHAIHQLGWEERDCIVFNDSQMFCGGHIKKYLQPKHSFYYIRDNLVEHPYFKRHGSRVEAATISEADAVFANSAYLADYAKAFNSKSFDIGQGCDLDMYDATCVDDEPADIASIPHPRIGYAGFLTGERLDIVLLESLAVKQPEWQWVLIGPEEIMFQQSRLHQMNNVHFLGAKQGSELPAYIQHIDVCMNPQLLNELTVGNYPRKIDEYLAMGKPTVATDTPAMKMFLPHVHLATGVEGYEQAIKKALLPQSTEHKQQAIAFASSHTWQSCINKIYEHTVWHTSADLSFNMTETISYEHTNTNEYTGNGCNTGCPDANRQQARSANTKAPASAF